MQVTYTVKNYAGNNEDRSMIMDMDKVCENLKSAGCKLNLEKLQEAVSYGFAVVIDEFQIEIRLVK
jgi:hypothetical protein